MEERTFDLTIPVTRGFRVTQTAMGVIFFILGLLNLESNTVLGAIQSAGGLMILIFVSLAQRINSYIIAFKDENLEIVRGMFRRRRIPWGSVTEIHIQLMKLDIGLESGRSVKIDFSTMSYNDNQMIKPQIVDAATAFAEAKGIEVKDSRAKG